MKCSYETRNSGRTTITMLIIDGNNMAYRAVYKYDLSNRGVDVSVTYGCLRMVYALVKKFEPSSVMVCWDGGIPTYRRERVPQYKAHRKKKDDGRDWDDIHRQMDELHDVAFPLHGIMSVRMQGAEADDIMYHASLMSPVHTTIVTTDEDLLQAVRSHVDVYSPTKDMLYTADNFKDLVGVDISNYIAYKSLVGDSSDNVPGAKGVGPKTAIKLFDTFGSISSIINAAIARSPNMSEHIAKAIIEYGFEGLCNSYVVMGLWYDRLGIRQTLMDELECYAPANISKLKQYLVHNAFVSLMDVDYYTTYAALEAPRLNPAGLRMPVHAPTERKGQAK